MQISVSMSLPDELASRLDALADATGQTKNYLAVQALQEFVAREEWQLAEILQALKEADDGNFANDSDMASLDRKWGFHDA